MAPEVIRHEDYGRPCDVYSYAILCWEMFTWSIPFPDHSPIQVAIAVATKGLRPELPSNAPPALAELVQRCWEQDAWRRPSFAEICVLVDAIDAAAVLQGLPMCSDREPSPSPVRNKRAHE